MSRPPLDRMVAEFFERSIKALDVCNAIRDVIERVRQWRTHLEIVMVALDSRQRGVGEGHLRRTKKALADLTITMLDDKDAGSVLAHRNVCVPLGFVVERIIREENMMAAQEILELFCEFIVVRLLIVQTQRA